MQDIAHVHGWTTADSTQVCMYASVYICIVSAWIVSKLYIHITCPSFFYLCAHTGSAHTHIACGKCCCSVQRKHKGTTVPNQNDEHKKNHSNCVYRIPISNGRPENLNYWVNCDKKILNFLHWQNSIGNALSIFPSVQHVVTLFLWLHLSAVVAVLI